MPPRTNSQKPKRRKPAKPGPKLRVVSYRVQPIMMLDTQSDLIPVEAVPTMIPANEWNDVVATMRREVGNMSAKLAEQHAKGELDL